MNKQLHISPRRLAIGLGAWLVITNALVGLAHVTDWWPVKILVFICIAFLPGVAMLRLLRISLRTFYADLVYSFGLSILVLMLSGLLANQLLPLFGWNQPLNVWGVLGAWNVVAIGLIAAAIHTNRRPLQINRWSPKSWTKPTWAVFGFSLLLPCLAAFGAFRLNNGGDALFAEITLWCLAATIGYCIIVRRRLPDGLLAWLIFVIGLTVLLMTSLRGWDMVGHDIEREFRVYTLTHLNSLWDISLNRDPYNACLSITILPQMLGQLLHVSGLIVFKVILQVIFAVCPVILFILLRQYTTKLGALIGVLLFICYPTFINDSAMLTRQGVAYLFFALSLLIISNHAQKLRYKLLFLLCAMGAILSHYSTAYMFVALFILAMVFKFGVMWWLRRKQPKPRPKVKGTVLSPLFAALLFLMTFIWYAQITATSSGLIVTLQKSVSHLPQLFSDDNKSTDTATALFFAGGKTQVDLYESYLSGSREITTKMADALRYLPGLTSDDLPITPLGLKAQAIGLSPSLIATLRLNFAKVLQVLALGSVVYVTYRLLKKKANTLDPDFICLSIAGVTILGLMVVLPVLSINYGVLRAFQQALIFLILPITLLIVALTRRIWPHLKTVVATLGMTFLFLLFTGMFAQLLGGVGPSLSLNNQGLYYGLFYTSAADTRAFAWMKDHIKKGNDVRAVNFNRAIMHDPQYPFTRVGILPTQIGADTFVYADPAQVVARKIYLYHESSPLIMTFPLDFYDNTKNRIYSTPSTRIYR
ncbi:MAG TPA: DUF2206 domain-containing protein [Candidatus Saccharimonadales bacterium]|nr:DUF2206 domain-containing protein [Candidatus Saccharimonadales bacterium]